MRRAPCKGCPWRISATASAIPGFDMEKAENLINTVGQEFGQPMMACHQSTEENEIHCVGFLAVQGWDNITVRMAVISGQIPAEALEQPPEEWGEMHESFDEMIEKLRETAR
jgi:hypothetical protein